MSHKIIETLEKANGIQLRSLFHNVGLHNVSLPDREALALSIIKAYLQSKQVVGYKHTLSNSSGEQLVFVSERPLVGVNPLSGLYMDSSTPVIELEVV